MRERWIRCSVSVSASATEIPPRAKIYPNAAAINSQEMIARSLDPVWSTPPQDSVHLRLNHSTKFRSVPFSVSAIINCWRINDLFFYLIWFIKIIKRLFLRLISRTHPKSLRDKSAYCFALTTSSRGIFQNWYSTKVISLVADGSFASNLYATTQNRRLWRSRVYHPLRYFQERSAELQWGPICAV